MATTPSERKEPIMAKATINSPFVGPGGKPVKITAEERDELALLGVDFDDAEPDVPTTEEPSNTDKEATS